MTEVLRLQALRLRPKRQQTTGFSYFPSETRGVMPPVIREKDDSFAESMFEFRT